MKLRYAIFITVVFTVHSTALHGIPLTTTNQFSSSDPVITFETGSTGLPGVPGVQFSGGVASFYWPSTPPPIFGGQYFGNLSGPTYLDIYFDQPQQAVGAYLVGANPFNGISGVIQVAYDQSNNIIEMEPQIGATWGSPPVFLGIGEPTAQIYRVEWRNVGGGYFGVDNVIYGAAIGLGQMPNIPTRLTAQRQGVQVALNWAAADRATSYNAKRASTSGGPYLTVGTNVIGTNYTDATVTNGAVYFYVVTAVNAYGESAVSQQAVAFVVDHLAFAPIASPQTSSVPFAVTVSARDSAGSVLSNFNGAVMLSAAGDRGAEGLLSSNTSAFVSGQWTGTITVDYPYPDTNVRLTSSSNGVAGLSNPFNVVAPAIQVFNGFLVADLAYSPFAQRLYAVAPASGPLFSNSLVVIDPVIGRVETNFYLGDDPSSLSISSDGQFIYIGFNGTNLFRRFNTASHSVDRQVTLQSPSQIAALPGLPSSVAVTAGNGTAIFDDGVQRSNIYPYGTFVVAGTANKLFVRGGGYPVAPFAILTADASGITNYTYEDGIVGYFESFKYQAGRTFTFSGKVFNPDTATILGSLTNCAIVEPDLAAGRIFSMGSHPVFGQSDAWRLYAWNATNFQVVGSLDIPSVYPGSPNTLARWGTNGIAFSVPSWYINQFFLVRTPLVVTVPPVLKGGSQPASGPFQLIFAGAQSVPYTVWGSTNLTSWTDLGPANLSSNGCFWFSDTNSSHYPNRFYRVGESRGP